MVELTSRLRSKSSDTCHNLYAAGAALFAGESWYQEYVECNKATVVATADRVCSMYVRRRIFKGTEEDLQVFGHKDISQYEQSDLEVLDVRRDVEGCTVVLDPHFPNSTNHCPGKSAG
jgi:hypothetical protein